MDELISALVLWLSLNFGLPQSEDHPTVLLVPPEHLAARRYGAQRAASGTEVVALYDPREQTVLLPHGWDRSEVADVSVLVHELVHHLQAKAGEEHRCPAAQEKLAFNAQDAWLKLFGTSLAESFGLDPMTLKVRTSCFSLP